MFRYFNIYGERQPLKGQYAPVIGVFLRQKDNGEKLTIVGDGTQRRDFTHVNDVVDANILAMETTNEECFGEVFNIGTFNNHSVSEIAQMIDHEYTFIPARKGEAESTLADITKARSLLKYDPTVEIEDWIKANR